MQVKDIRRIAVIGAGNMGHQITTLCAMHGFETWCTDSNQAQLDKAADFVKHYLPGRVAKERITQKEADKAAGLIHFEPDFEKTVAPADFVIEAVFEKESLKRDLFTRMGRLCRPGTVIVTNSSYLPSSKLADCVPDPSKVCNMHFFNPALVMKCVEIMRGPHTGDDTFQLVVDLTIALERVPTRILKEIHGMIVNRILQAINREAYYLMETGYASFEDIDNATVNALGHPMGPFRLNDLTGIDLSYTIGMERFRASGNRADLPWPSVTEKYFKGEWGQKTGKGFYEYPPREEDKP